MTTTDQRIAIRVHGIPVPQGSKKPVTRKGRPALVDDNDKVLRPWRTHVTDTARDTTRYYDDLPLTGPVRIWLRFTFARPPSHYRTGRNAHLLRYNAPRWPTHLRDIDKLQRAVLDALTDAQVWRDDGQVVHVAGAWKFYAGEHELAMPSPGVDIILEEIS